MDNLQNNYTTIQQAKRLLELGVPENSADCYWEPLEKVKGEWVYRAAPFVIRFEAEINHVRCFFPRKPNAVIPCWSLGRLMIIYDQCTDRRPLYIMEDWKNTAKIAEEGYYKNYIDFVVRGFEYAVEHSIIDYHKIGKIRKQMHNG